MFIIDVELSIFCVIFTLSVNPIMTKLSPYVALWAACMFASVSMIGQRYGFKQLYSVQSMKVQAAKASPPIIIQSSVEFSECAMNTDYELYVLDAENACIYVFSESGSLLRIIKTIETTTGKVELRAPKHICFDRFNTLYIYDSKLGIILRVPVKGDANYLGTAGWGPGELGDVIDLAVDSKGNCYALNRSRNVVDVYASDGTYLTWISGQKPFQAPIAIGLNGADELYVLEEEGPNVVVFNDEGNVVNTNSALGSRKNVGLKEAVSLAVIENGDFFVLDGKTCVTYHFSRVGDVIGSLGSKGESREGVFDEAVQLYAISGITNHLAITDEEAGVVQTFMLDQLKSSSHLPARKIKMVESSSSRKPVYDLAVSSTGLRFAIPYDNRSKVIAYKDTSQVDAFTISGAIEEAAAIACDTSGNLFVADRGADEVLMFDAAGRLVRRLGKEIETKLKNPVGLVIQNSGNLVVADEGRGSLMQWNAKGQFLKEITSEANSVLRSPMRIDCDSKDQIYVWDDDLNVILRIGSGGWPTAEKQLSVRREKPGGSPGLIGDFYVDPLDQIHVFNKTNHQIEVYSWDFEPVMIYSIGHPGGGRGSIGNAEQMVLDTRTLNVYLTQDKGKTQRVFHYLIPPPIPEGDMLFDVIDGKLIANFSRLKSKAVVAYGLTRPTAMGDSVVYRTEGSSFTITQPLTDQTLHRYGFVALSWSDYSDASMSFDDYFNYAEAMVHARKYQEALGSWILALETMGRQTGIVEHIAKRMAEVSGELLAMQNIDLAIDFIKEAFKLSPKSLLVKGTYRDAVMAKYSQLINQREINVVINDMQLHINNQNLRSIYLETADTLARVLSLQENLTSINDAIKVQRKLLEWESKPEYKQSLAISFFELYKFKSMRETSALELRSILEESLANSRDAYNVLKLEGKSYFTSHLVQIASMNELGKYDDVQQGATAELGASASVMPSDVIVAYRTELAKAFYAKGNLLGAESEYTTVLSLESTNRNAREALVEVLIQESKFDAASEMLHQLMLGKEELPEYTIQIGRIALLKNNPSEAVFQLEKVISKDPSLRQAFIYLGDAYSHSANYLQAIKSYNRALQFVDEQISKFGQGKRNKQLLTSLPKERIRILNALVRINTELQDYQSAYVASQRLIKLDESVAESHYHAGNACLQLGRIYHAIEHFNKAISLDEEQETYRSALSSAIQLRDQQVNNAAPLSIGEVLMNEIFPSIYKNYSDVHQLPAGEFVLTNNTDGLITPSSISVFCADVMLVPTQVNTVAILAKSNSVVRFPAIFSENILSNSEALTRQMEVVIIYTHQGAEQTIRKSGTFTLNGRNAIVWSDKRRMASFIAPSNQMLVDYNKQADQLFKGMPKYGLNRSVLKAGQIYALLSHSDLTYSSDPNQGYASLSQKTEVKDFLQYPLETLQRRGGDCDDLVALYAALLESGGVSAAYIDLTGHVMAAFDSGIRPSEIADYGILPSEVIVLNDIVWIPIEATKIGTGGFFQAWKMATERYYREVEAGQFPQLIPIAEAWNIYNPATYQPVDFAPIVPSDTKVKDEYKEFVLQFVSKTKQHVLDELAARCIAEPNNVYVRNAYATLLTQTGQFEKAKKVFRETLAMTPESAIILNNLGNIEFLQGKFAEAADLYFQASQLDEKDAQIHINLCKSYWQLGDKPKSRASFEKAESLDSSVSDIYHELKKQIQ